MRFADLLEYRAPPGALSGRNLVVTGASRGIGEAVARAAAAAGAQVVLLGRDVAALEGVYDRIEAEGGAAVIYPLDLESAAYPDFERLAEQVEAELGSVDGLVSNAAMLGDLTPLVRYDPTLWARVYQVNLHAPFMMVQCLLPALSRSADAAVLFTLDGAVRRPAAYRGAYASSKAAAEAMLGTLAEEYEQRGHPRFHGLVPPPVHTRLRTRAFPAEDPGGLPTPAAVAPPFVYLLGPDGRSCRQLVID